MAKTLKIGIISTLLSQWWIPLVILVILFLVYLLIQNKVDKRKYLTSNLTEEQKTIKYVTERIIQSLGVGFGHPIYGENWSITEDEEEVVKLLLEHPLLFNKINDKYFELMSDNLTGTSDLVTDLHKYLSKHDIKKIEHLWL